MADSKSIEFLRERIMRKLDKIREDVGEVRYMLYRDIVEECKDENELRHMLDIDLQVDYIEYVGTDIGNKLKKYGYTLADVHEIMKGFGGIVEQDVEIESDSVNEELYNFGVDDPERDEAIEAEIQSRILAGMIAEVEGTEGLRCGQQYAYFQELAEQEAEEREMEEELFTEEFEDIDFDVDGLGEYDGSLFENMEDMFEENTEEDIDIDVLDGFDFGQEEGYVDADEVFGETSGVDFEVEGSMDFEGEGEEVLDEFDISGLMDADEMFEESENEEESDSYNVDDLFGDDGVEDVSEIFGEEPLSEEDLFGGSDEEDSVFGESRYEDMFEGSDEYDMFSGSEDEDMFGEFDGEDMFGGADEEGEEIFDADGMFSEEDMFGNEEIEDTLFDGNESEYEIDDSEAFDWGEEEEENPPFDSSDMFGGIEDMFDGYEEDEVVSTGNSGSTKVANATNSGVMQTKQADDKKDGIFQSSTANKLFGMFGRIVDIVDKK